MTVPWRQEEGLCCTGGAARRRDAGHRDRISKRFYDHFQQEHAAFLACIKGIPELGDQEWYAAVMLNRVMFVYFLQRQGFLDADRIYLQNRLKAVQQRQGKRPCRTFYRYFLRRLFHEGLARQPAQRPPDLDDLLGDIPYLNGGVFELHALEQQHPDIDIPDAAFERLFACFDQYEWHLDTRPRRSDRAITPDVLGDILETAINRKQMGAYYTKEDVTAYIAKNTVIPCLFDAVQKQCATAFQQDSPLWQLLRDDPDGYMYEPVRKGVDLPLPEEIARGTTDVSQRRGWNRPAAREFALPTESWREHIVRRQRCRELRNTLQAGAVHQINDLITYNLDLCQFAADVMTHCAGPGLLWAFYQALSTVTILDPTCGSGAFLLAALNILAPLYEACLDRMQVLVDGLERAGECPHSVQFADLRRTLAEVAKHPNRHYFLLKSIMVNNLYGVDIMAEAVEICKLRLLLTLVAQADRVTDLEPLPDLDFNIRLGNTLVGFVAVDEMRRAAERAAAGQGKPVVGATEKALRRLAEDAASGERALLTFRRMQTTCDIDARDFATAKQALRQRLQKLADELDGYLAGAYGIDPSETQAYDQWRRSHQPFHWCAAFYGIMSRGGFGAVIGNPPYLAPSKLGNRYAVQGLRTLPCRDMYAWFVERSFALQSTLGRLGVIIPVSVASSGSFDVLRDVISAQCPRLWMAHFANRPSQLFVGAQNRLTIILSTGQGAHRQVYSTCYHRWGGRRGAREVLFDTLHYVPLATLSRSFRGLYPKVGATDAIAVLRKIATPHALGNFVTTKPSPYAVYWVRVPGYFCQFFLEPPQAKPETGGAARRRGEVHAIYLREPMAMRLAHALLNSSTYYQFFTAYTDGRHINPADVTEFPFDLPSLPPPVRASLVTLSKQLEETMITHTSVWRKSGLLIASVKGRLLKPVIDQIDRILAEHYGFTGAELDFIINYDIKYRMGQDDGERDA